MSYRVPCPGEQWRFKPIRPRTLVVDVITVGSDDTGDWVTFRYQTGTENTISIDRFVQNYELAPAEAPQDGAA